MASRRWLMDVATPLIHQLQLEFIIMENPAERMLHRIL
jgi:hypothetical protein